MLHTSGSCTWIALGILVAFFFKSRLRTRALRLPPGPAPLPIVGNILHMPARALGREFADLSKTYGDVIHLSVLGQSIVMLGSYKAATDLMDKRSANYSDRPESVMVPLAGFSWLFVLMNYGSEWRQHRRAFHQQMNSEVVARYEPTQLDLARALLRSILASPQELADHLIFAFTAVTLQVAYGIQLKGTDDKYYHMVERIGSVGEEIVVPGRFLVEAIPWLQYLPGWFPGADFKRYAALAKRDILHTVDHLFATAKAAMDSGQGQDSFVSHSMLSSNYGQEVESEQQEVYKGVAAAMYVAGADTTNAVMRAFFLAMALYPDVQKKAQAEIDEVVGASRLPEFSDRPSLPYTCALVYELLRWHIVTPIGVPHRAVSDDEYNGYLIPAGATILANVWAISRDPAVYPDPEDLIPERFLNTSGCLDVKGKDPTSFAFGFGRRICPGRHFAESSLFINCASLLWAFSIGPPVDGQGNPVRIERSVTTDAVVSHATVYNYTIKPRSSQAKRLVEES